MKAVAVLFAVLSLVAPSARHGRPGRAVRGRRVERVERGHASLLAAGLLPGNDGTGFRGAPASPEAAATSTLIESPAAAAQSPAGALARGESERHARAIATLAKAIAAT